MSEKIKTAWLIDNGKTGDAARYRGWIDGLPCWVSDPYKALWFVRREDAEAISAEDEDALRIAKRVFQL